MALLLQACASDPSLPAARASVQMPTGWQAGESSAESTPITSDWWKAFNSPALEQLIAEAQTGSVELRVAAERIRQAQIALGSTGASRWPSANANLGTSTSETKAADTPATTRDSSSAGVSISYEIDLWGRIAAGVRAGEASLKASEYDWQAARLSLLASVATQYFTWLSLGERNQLAEDNVKTAERVLAIVQAKQRNGVATTLEVSQQEGTVLTQRIALLTLQQQREQSATALALLLGRTPLGYEPPPQAQGLDVLRVPELAPGLPASLLTRRPDLASAEANLAAADANVDAARKALLPSLSLSASSGWSSVGLLTLADPTQSLSLGASLAQSIFDGGTRRAAIRLSESQRRVLIENYGLAIRTALKEVADALSQTTRGQQQEDLQRKLVEQAQRTLRLAELRYREGTGDLLSVLDAQRSLFSAQDALSTQRVARLSAALDLYKALGGDWTPPPKMDS